MNILQNCLIELLELNGFTVLFMDNYVPGRNIYYFDGHGSAALVLTDSCISEGIAAELLKSFRVTDPVTQLEQVSPACQC